MERTQWLTRQAIITDLSHEEALLVRDSRLRKQVRCIHETVDLLSLTVTQFFESATLSQRYKPFHSRLFLNCLRTILEEMPFVYYPFR